MSLDVYLTAVNECAVFEANITHNLGPMAARAGIYQHLWRPEELGITTAGQLVEPLTEGLKRLTESPAEFEIDRPGNGWGTYDGLVRFVTNYIEACKEHPDATVRASR
jgi:hypothetical protein